MKKNLHFLFVVLLLLSLWTFAVPAAAEPKQNPSADPVAEALEDAEDENGEVYLLEGLHVKGVHPGEFVLDRATIEATPSATATITDLFRGRSDIQYDSGSRSGMQGGEITPPKISIHGAKHYDNNFTINGMGINSNLNPGGYEHTAYGGIPSGDSQGIILDTELIDSVKVYTENVPARYGEFMGGVLDARLRDAATDAWHGMFSFRYTSSEMARIHYTDADNAKDSTVSSNKQPQFYKHYWSGRLEGPLWEDGPGLMLTYVNNNSVIPLDIYSGAGSSKVKELRENQNFLVKLNTPASSPFFASLTGIYAPYKAKLYTTTLRNGGGHFVEGGGLSLLLNTRYDVFWGRWSNDFSYNSQQLNRTNDESSLYQWRIGTPSITWASSNTTANEGGFGDYKMSQKTWAWLSNFEAKAFGPSWFTNQFELGFEMKRIFYNSEDSGYSTYLVPANGINAGATGSREDGVITGEQFARTKTVKPASDRSENVFTFATWLQDTIELERLTLRPGIRISYDSMTKNTDIAPRLFANLDILNDDSLNVFGGYSRYYGTQLMERALRATMNGFDTYTRSRWDQPWRKISSARDNTYRLGDLKTPYTDEYSLGASVNVWDTLFKVSFVNRQYRDQIMGRAYREDGSTTNMFEYSNKGKMDYWGLTYSISRDFDLGDFGKHYCELSATYSETTGNYTEWTNASFDESDGNPLTAASRDPDYILLDGSLSSKSDIKADNFNSPWIIAYTHRATFWNERIRFMGQLRWEQGGNCIYSVSNTTERGPSGLLLNAYKTGHQPDTLNVDAKLSIDAIKYNSHTLTLEVEALNLLDRKNLSHVGATQTSQGTYSMGRQFYLGFRYTF